MNFKKAIALGTLITLTLVNSGVHTFAIDKTQRASNQEEINVNEKKEETLQLNVEEAITYALKNSKDMIIQKIELQKSALAYSQNIRAVKQGEKALDISIPGPRTYEVTSDDTVNMALLEYGVSRRSVELAYQIAKWNLEIKENQIKYNVEKAYFDLLQMEKDLDISKENLILTQKQYDNGKLKFNIGVISEQELLGLEMSLSQAQTTYDSTKIYYDLQMMNFQNTLGLPFDKEVFLTDKIEYRAYEPIKIEESIREALQKNVMIRVVEENHELAELTLKATKTRYPENTYKYKEKEAEVAQTTKNLETTKNGIEMSVRGAYLNLLTAERQIKTIEQSIKQAESMLRLAEISFDLGQGTSTEISQANLNLMNAKKSLSSQIHAFNMALLDYEYSIGIGKTLIGGM